MKALLNHTGKAVPWVLLALGCLLFLYGVGARDLWAPDEDEYAQISREMIRSGNWLIPTCNGEAWTIKPVLMNWMISAVSLPFGDVNEFRARVFSSLGALGTFFLVYLLGTQAFSRRAGILSALVLGTSVLFLEQARWAQTYMLSCFFTTLAICAFYRGYTTPERRTLAYMVMVAAAALGVLTMGPVNLAVPGLVCFVFILVRGDLGHLKEMRLVRGILLFIAVVAPWYVMMSLKADYGFDLLVKTNLTRYLDAWTHSRPWYYYPPDLVWTFAPWSFFLPGAFVLAFSRRSREDRPGMTLVLVWFFSLLIFFSTSDGKRPTYLLGAYPAMGLLVGYLLDRALHAWPERFYRKAIVIPCLLLAALWTLVAIGAPIGAAVYDPSFLFPALGLAVLTAACAAWMIVAWRKDRPHQLVVIPAVFMLGLILYGVHVLIPRAEPFKSMRPFSESVRARLDENPELSWGMYRCYRAIYVYYADHFTTVIPDEEALAAFLDRPNPSLIVTTRKHFGRQKEGLLADAEVLDERTVGRHELLLLKLPPGDGAMPASDRPASPGPR